MVDERLLVYACMCVRGCVRVRVRVRVCVCWDFSIILTFLPDIYYKVQVQDTFLFIHVYAKSTVTYFKDLFDNDVLPYIKYCDQTNRVYIYIVNSVFSHLHLLCNCPAPYHME